MYRYLRCTHFDSVHMWVSTGYDYANGDIRLARSPVCKSVWVTMIMRNRISLALLPVLARYLPDLPPLPLPLCPPRPPPLCSACPARCRLVSGKRRRLRPRIAARAARRQQLVVVGPLISHGATRVPISGLNRAAPLFLSLSRKSEIIHSGPPITR